MVKLSSKKFYRAISFNLGGGRRGGNKLGSDHYNQKECGGKNIICEVKWELRPGGMLVQKRESSGNSNVSEEEMINVRVSTISKCHDISIEATSTFGELKMILSLVTSLEPREQRILFKGKEREDKEYLHMVGVRDKDKVLLLQDPAIKETKLHHGLAPCRTISV